MLGKRLRDLRTKKGLRQEDVAKVAGVTPEAIGMYENNRREPKGEILRAIVSYLGTSIDYLHGRTDDASPPGQPQEPEELEALLRGRGFTKEDIEWIRMIEEKRARERKEKGPKPKPDHPF